MDIINWLQLDTVNQKDKMLRVLTNAEFLDACQLRLLVCEFASEAIELVDKPDKRSVKAIAVARRYAIDKATNGELRTAYVLAHNVIPIVWKAYYTENPNRRAYIEFAAESAAYAAAGHADFIREHAWSAAYSACLAKWLWEPGIEHLTAAHYQWQVERVIAVLKSSHKAHNQKTTGSI